MENGNGSALALAESSHSPQALAVSEYHRRATDVAGLVREMVLKRTVKIGAKNYVPVECYQAVANAMGCVGSARDVKRVEGGYTAIGEVKRLSDGAVVAEGEGFVGDDEPKWAKGPEYARRSMVQTRAIGRACRAAFAFVVPMIDAGLSTTPAEEMDGIAPGSETPPAPATRAPASRGTAPLRETLRPSPPQSTPAPRGDSPPPHTDADFRPDHDARTGEVKPAHVPTTPPSHDRNFVMPFANKQNEPLHELSEKSLKWFQSALTENIDNPDKARFRDKACAQLRLIEAEMAFRGL